MTTSRLAKQIAIRKEVVSDIKARELEVATDKAVKLNFKDRGTAGQAEIEKTLLASGRKREKSLLDSGKKSKEDLDNVDLYGKDAMKGKGFATTGRPKAVNAGASRPATQSGTPKGK